MLRRFAKSSGECFEKQWKIHSMAGGGNGTAKSISDKADTYDDQQKTKIAETTRLALMEGFPIPMWNSAESIVKRRGWD